MVRRSLPADVDESEHFEMLGEPMKNLALLYEAQGENEIALRFRKQRLEMCLAACGKESKEVALARWDVALLAAGMDQYDESLSQLDTLLKMREQAPDAFADGPTGEEVQLEHDRVLQDQLMQPLATASSCILM